MNRNCWWVVLLVSSVAVSCKSKAADDVEKQAEQATKPVPVPAIDEAPLFEGARALRCEFVGAEDTKQAKLTNLGPEAITEFTIWGYQNADAKLIKRATKQLTHRIESDATKKIALGAEFGVATDCEVSEVRWDGGTRWSNKNLIYRVGDSRPAGGESDDVLASRSRTKVEVTPVPSDGGLAFDFKNVSGRPLKVNQVGLRFLAADGAVLRKAAVRATLMLSPGANESQTLAYPVEQIPPKTDSIVAKVASIQFADGDKETVSNHND